MASTHCAHAISRARARAPATAESQRSSRTSSSRQHMLSEATTPIRAGWLASTAMWEIVSAPSAIAIPEIHQHPPRVEPGLVDNEQTVASSPRWSST
jgi:hypothetical protein